MLTLKQFRYFEALARMKHFGRAAKDCAVTQPALSMQIQELEADLGLSLVERKRNGISLTPEGEEVARRAERILSDIADLKAYASSRSGELCGQLSLGVIPTIAPYLLPAALPILKSRFPELDLRLRESQTDKLLDRLSRGQLDAVLLALPTDHADLEEYPLFTDRFLLATPSERYETSDIAGLNIIMQERLLLLEDGHCLRDQALSFCQIASNTTLETFGATSLATVIQMVANGYGVTLLPEICARTEERDDRITLLPFSPPEPSRLIGLAWRKSSPRRKEFEKLGAVLKELCP